jgi:Vilmaviridae nuclease
MHSFQRITTWKQIPGNWDTLNFSQVFESDNEYGIPTIEKNARMPSQLLQWGSRPSLLAVKEGSNTAVHFFLDDYRFESLWNNPLRNIDALMKIGLVLSPDFSLWIDMPVAMQIWNTYRNRWLACFWQQYGISVIPTISWSHSFDFCFLGIPTGSIVALSSVGIAKSDREAQEFFRTGFYTMIEAIQPEAILSYGSLLGLDIHTDRPIVTFPTRWQQRRSQRTIKAKKYPLWESIHINREMMEDEQEQESPYALFQR